METLSKTKLGKYSLLRQKKHRIKEELFVVAGEKAVKDTLNSFEAEAIIIKNGLEKPDWIKKDLKIMKASEGELKKISSMDSVPDVIAIYRIPHMRLPSLKVGNKKFTLVLDDIQDPGNMGTIIRTAHWFGIEKIFCSQACVDIYNPKVVQSTMGSIAKVEITYCNLSELFQANPEVPVYGLLLEGNNIFEIKDFNPGFIVMGSEGHGPSKETREKITQGLTIPPSNPHNSPDSLNVAVATAITLAQIMK